MFLGLNPVSITKQAQVVLKLYMPQLNFQQYLQKKLKKFRMSLNPLFFNG